MSTLEFIEGTPPEDYRSDAELFLYHLSDHRALQSVDGWISFHLVDRAKKRISASVYFHVANDIAISPNAAPFGSIIFSPKLSLEALFSFITEMDLRLKSKGVTQVLLKNAAFSYTRNSAQVLSVLLANAGYSINNAEINLSIPVDATKFDERIDSWELRKLKQSKKAGLKFKSLPATEINTVYNFISACRTERAQTLSMTSEAIEKLAAKFPRHVILSGVFQKEIMMAAGISLRAGKDVLYNFYTAHPKSADALSPIVLLTEGTYKLCQDAEISQLDLGTSALNGMPNFNLLEFKLRLGGVPSAKFTFTKQL